MKNLLLSAIVILITFQLSYAQTSKSKQANSIGAFADVNGIHMYYEIHGKGMPLLMIHGNGDSSGVFKNQVDVFDDFFKVIVTDSRGQGKTTNDSDSMTYELMAEDYKAFLDQLKIDSAYIIGWSDGGIIGLLLARDYPEKVKMLVAMGANLQPDSTAVPGSVIKWLEDEMTATKRNLAADVEIEKSEKYLQLLHLMYYQPNIPAATLHDIQCPVLVMSGDRDIIKLKHTLKIYNAIPNAQLCVIPGATHFVVKEDPQRFNQMVMQFFMQPFSMPDSMDYFR